MRARIRADTASDEATHALIEFSNSSPSMSCRAFAASSADFVCRQRFTAASMKRPLNIAPFSIGAHQPSAFGFPSRHSSGGGSDTEPSRSVKSIMTPCRSTKRRQISACACPAAVAASAAKIVRGSNAALAVAASVVDRNARRFMAVSLEMRTEKFLHKHKTLRIEEFLAAMHAARHDYKFHGETRVPIRGIQFARLPDGHLWIGVTMDEQ